jgi:serine/threonine protein kinase
MEVDPSERITAQEASSHDWITKKDRDDDCPLPLAKENFTKSHCTVLYGRNNCEDCKKNECNLNCSEWISLS